MPTRRFYLTILFTKNQYGEVFRLDMFGSSMVFLLSEEGHEFFFKTSEDIFSARYAQIQVNFAEFSVRLTNSRFQRLVLES